MSARTETGCALDADRAANSLPIRRSGSKTNVAPAVISGRRPRMISGIPSSLLLVTGGSRLGPPFVRVHHSGDGHAFNRRLDALSTCSTDGRALIIGEEIRPLLIDRAIHVGILAAPLVLHHREHGWIRLVTSGDTLDLPHDFFFADFGDVGIALVIFPPVNEGKVPRAGPRGGRRAPPLSADEARLAMQPLTESAIRGSFVNVSRKEVADLALPKDVDSVDWSAVDYLGWRDRRRGRRAYVVVPLEVRKAGAAGRAGDSIGTLVCSEFECSVNVRQRPPVAYIGFDVDAARAERIATLWERTIGFVREVLGEA